MANPFKNSFLRLWRTCRAPQAQGRGNKLATSNLAPNSERNPNFFQGKSAGGFGLNSAQRFRPPPLRFGKTEKFSLHFLIFSRAFFSFKRKRKFFCGACPPYWRMFLLIREKRKRSISNRKRAKIFTPSEANGFPSGPSPQPPFYPVVSSAVLLGPFCPFAFRAEPDFFRRNWRPYFAKQNVPPKE